MKHKREVLRALRRSPDRGGYIQGTGQLFTDDGEHSFCCLGVMTDLAVKQGLLTWEEELPWLNVFKRDDEVVYEVSDAESVDTMTFAPQVVCDYFGLTPADQDTLSFMNDGGKSFAEIADYIEVNL